MRRSCQRPPDTSPAARLGASRIIAPVGGNPVPVPLPISRRLGLGVAHCIRMGSVREVLQKPKADGHGMRVMSQSPDPLARMHTMTKRQGKTGRIDVKAVLADIRSHILPAGAEREIPAR